MTPRMQSDSDQRARAAQAVGCTTTSPNRYDVPDRDAREWNWHAIIMLGIAAWVPIGIALAFIGAIFLP